MFKEMGINYWIDKTQTLLEILYCLDSKGMFDFITATK